MRLLPPLLLLAAILSLFWSALLHPSHILHPTFSPFSDTMVIHWPKAYLMARSWQAGAGLPHWTPLILSGMPLAANQLAMLSYPPAWLFLILPLELIFNLLFVFHLLLGGLGIYLLLYKGHHLSPAASLLGGLTFALNGKWLAHAAGGHVSMVAAIGWMPWVLFGLHMLLQGKGSPGTEGEEKIQERRSAGVQRRNLLRFSSLPPSPLGWVILVAVSLAMQIVTHTLPLIYSVYLIGAMVGWYLVAVMNISKNSQSPAIFAEIRRLFLPLLAIPILAGLLGAGQLLPAAGVGAVQQPLA